MSNTLALLILVVGFAVIIAAKGAETAARLRLGATEGCGAFEVCHVSVGEVVRWVICLLGRPTVGVFEVRSGLAWPRLGGWSPPWAAKEDTRTEPSCHAADQRNSGSAGGGRARG